MQEMQGYIQTVYEHEQASEAEFVVGLAVAALSSIHKLFYRGIVTEIKDKQC